MDNSLSSVCEEDVAATFNKEEAYIATGNSRMNITFQCKVKREKKNTGKYQKLVLQKVTVP